MTRWTMATPLALLLAACASPTPPVPGTTTVQSESTQCLARETSTGSNMIHRKRCGPAASDAERQTAQDDLTRTREEARRAATAKGGG